MLILGAKGLAKEVIQILENQDFDSEIYLYDDVNLKDSNILFDKYLILKTEQEVKQKFKTDNKFLLGLGNPYLRLKLYKRFLNLGGVLEAIMSDEAYIGNHVKIDVGATIMSGVKISNGVQIGKAVLAYYNVIITHDVQIGNFVELSPGCKLLGNVVVEDDVQIGSGAIVLPKLTIGKGSIVGAGAVVTKNVKPNSTVIGSPAKQLFL